jgi:hypothetical protein
MTWIQTRSGIAFDLLNPDPKDVRIDDIAFSLAHINRYCGHAGVLNVAEHSIRVAQYLIPQYGVSCGLGGLLHDAHETYYGDMSSPLIRAYTKLFPEFREIRSNLTKKADKAILTALDLEDIDLYDLAIKDADARICHNERIQFLGDEVRPWSLPGGPLEGVLYEQLSPEDAVVRFLQLFRALVAEYRRC